MPNHAVDGHLNMGYANSGQMASRTSSAGSQIGYEMANANLNDPVQLRQPSEGFHTAEGFHDKYEIGETLGKGSFAVVKEARHRQSGERFAIKMIDRNNPGASPQPWIARTSKGGVKLCTIKRWVPRREPSVIVFGGVGCRV
eukprot:1176777-Rhodomonas_salina.1